MIRQNRGRWTMSGTLTENDPFQYLSIYNLMNNSSNNSYISGFDK